MSASIKRKRFILENTGPWADEFLVAILEWAIPFMEKRYGRRTDLKRPLAVKATNYQFGFRGRAYPWRGRILVRMPRRFHKHFPYQYDYAKYEWKVMRTAHSRVELFAGLIIHELIHIYDQAQEDLKPSATELRTCRHENECMPHFRKAWPAIRRKMAAAMRRNREAAKREAAKRTPDAKRELKIVRAREAIKRWESKQKRAATALRKYRATLRRLERDANRVAADRG